MEKEHTKILLTATLKNNYNIDTAHLAQLALGADIDAVIYKVIAEDQKEYFVKLKRTHSDMSVTLQLLLHKTGIQEIIAPITTLDRKAASYADSFTLIVYPFIEGQDGFSKRLTDDQWIMLGQALRRIHEIHLPPSIASYIKQESYSSQWTDAVRSIYDNIASVKPCDQIASDFLAYMQEYKSVIMRLVERAETLANVIQQQSVTNVLCHGDLHAGNVLIANNGALYIIDWDQPIQAPKERDLMFIGAGVGNVWNNNKEVKLFYTGYGKTEINYEIMNYYRSDRIIQDIAEYHQLLLANNLEYNDKLTCYNHFVAMFAPNGVVDIALKADAYL